MFFEPVKMSNLVATLCFFIITNNFSLSVLTFYGLKKRVTCVFLKVFLTNFLNQLAFSFFTPFFFIYIYVYKTLILEKKIIIS